MAWDIVNFLSILGGLALAYLIIKPFLGSYGWKKSMGIEGDGRYDPSHLPISGMLKGFRRTTMRWSTPRYLEGMSDPFLDELLFIHALKASKERKRMWIRYKGMHRPESERIIEIYKADVDESIFAWCCLRQEPRIFERDRVLAWSLLPERFYRDPLLAIWAEEEYPHGRDAIPWNRWRQMKSVEVGRQEYGQLPIPQRGNREIFG